MKRQLLALALCAATSSPFAAGGHHAVDDAALLDASQCELESWWSRARGGERLLHAGGGCRFGPVELSLAAEHARTPGGSESTYAPQVKWATELAPGFSVGALASPTWQARQRPRHQATTVLALASWMPLDNVALHANLGRDFLRSGPHQSRGGVSVEWSPHPQAWLVGELFRQERANFARVGVRWLLREHLALDLSRAQRTSAGPSDAAWTLGLGWQFAPR